MIGIEQKRFSKITFLTLRKRRKPTLTLLEEETGEGDSSIEIDLTLGRKVETGSITDQTMKVSAKVEIETKHGEEASVMERTEHPLLQNNRKSKQKWKMWKIN